MQKQLAVLAARKHISSPEDSTKNSSCYPDDRHVHMSALLYVGLIDQIWYW